MLNSSPAAAEPAWDGRTVGELFTERALAVPGTEAVVSRDGRRSYAELARDVDRVAAFLVARGVGREVHVGVMLPRSYELVVSLLAVLKAGGVYVPLNPTLPDARLWPLLEDTRPAVLLSHRALAARPAPQDGAAAPAAPVRADLEDLLDGAGGADGGPAADRHAPRAAAYVIQTSGSTGRPKSVQVEMGSLVNLLRWCSDACRIHAGSRVLQVIASSFDASIRSYLTPLVTGATLVLLDDGPYDPAVLLGWIEREAVSVLNPSVPSMFYPVVELAAADGYRPLASLRTLALGAESPDLGALGPWIDSPGFRARILNVYGPTEAADIGCYAELALR